jgi:enoyl-CoA hydratase/carnithine racemase
MPLNTPLEALTSALVLAITAPDDDRAARAIALADEIAAMCPPGHIALAKRAALDELRRLDGESAHA